MKHPFTFLKNYLIILLFFFTPGFFNLTHAQITFEKLYGGVGTETANDVEIVSSGGYITVGHTTTYGAGDADVYIVKTDINGNDLWTKTVGGIGVDYGYSIQETSGGNYIIVGSTTSYGAGMEDVYLLNIDANSNVLWEKTIGGTGSDIGREVLQTTDGGYIVVGYTNSPGAQYFDIYLIKTDASGNTLWTKTYGDIGFENGRSIKQTSDGGYIMVGQTSSFGAGGTDIYLIKTDMNGNTIWTKTYGDAGSDEGKYVQLTSDGGYILLGDYDIYGLNNSDIYVIKTNSTGDTLWTAMYGGIEKDVSKIIEPTSDGGYCIAGVTRSFGLINPDVWLFKINSSGGTIWSKTYGSADHDHGHSAEPTSDGGYIVVGHATNMIPGNMEDVYMLKVDDTGNISPTSVEQDINLLAGDFTMYPNPSEGVLTLEFSQILSLSHIKLYDGIGRVLYQETINESNSVFQKTLDLSKLQKGTYYIGIVSKNNYLAVKPVLLL